MTTSLAHLFSLFLKGISLAKISLILAATGAAHRPSPFLEDMSFAKISFIVAATSYDKTDFGKSHTH